MIKNLDDDIKLFGYILLCVSGAIISIKILSSLNKVILTLILIALIIEYIISHRGK